MKYQINAVIHDLDNQVIVFEDKPLTWVDALYRAIITPAPGAESSEKKYEAYTIAGKLKSARDGIVHLTPKEAETLREASVRAWGVVVYGRIQDFLNGGDDPKPSKPGQ